MEKVKASIEIHYHDHAFAKHGPDEKTFPIICKVRETTGIVQEFSPAHCPDLLSPRVTVCHYLSWANIYSELWPIIYADRPYALVVKE